MLLSEAPLSRLALVAATIVMVSDSPLASEAYVTVCGFNCGLLLQTPPPVEAQETIKVPAGRLSTMVADVGSGPLLVTLIVYVTLDPDSTDAGAADLRECEIGAHAAPRRISGYALNFADPVHWDIAQAFQSAGAVDAENSNAEVFVRGIEE